MIKRNAKMVKEERYVTKEMIDALTLCECEKLAFKYNLKLSPSKLFTIIDSKDKQTIQRKIYCNRSQYYNYYS